MLKEKDKNCKQPHIKAKELEAQIDLLLATIDIPKDFIDWAMEVLRNANDEEVNNRQFLGNRMKVSLDQVDNKVDTLMSMFLSEGNKD